jgi:photosystem II stability/assembly factor-like uncharacterized protein
MLNQIWLKAACATAAVAMTATAVITTAGAASATVLTAGAAFAAPAVGPVPRGFQPASMTFVSANEGWVLGTAPCAHAPCTSVVRTTNGGRSWVGIPAPRYKLATFYGTAGLIRMRFADPVDGFAFGSQLWATHNGGASWHRVTEVPGYIADLEASAGVVYAASQRSNRVTIYSTPAGSDSWHRVSGLPTVSAYAGLGTITLHGRAGWIILGSRLYSTPNGSRWVRDSIRCPALLGMTSVGAYSSTQITMLCLGDPAAGSSGKMLYASSDGGTRFTRVGSLPLGGDGLGLLAEPTTRHLFVAIYSGATWLYVSTDGGKHWRTGLFIGDGGKGWNDFGFTTATQGVAVEGLPSQGSHMYMTKNAGRTWRIVRF